VPRSWFDGGTGLGSATIDRMVALRQRLQPNAVTFGGCAAMPVNSVAWVGTESGHAPYPLWYSHDGESNVCLTDAPCPPCIYQPRKINKAPVGGSLRHLCNGQRAGSKDLHAL
jgi:hypothetical protein